VSYLGLALVAEGPTDYRFLSPVLYRLTEDLCLSFGITTIEVGPVTALELDQRVGLSRAAQIVEAARASAGSSRARPISLTRCWTISTSCSTDAGSGRTTVLKRRLSADDSSLTPRSRSFEVAIRLKPRVAATSVASSAPKRSRMR